MGEISDRDAVACEALMALEQAAPYVLTALAAMYAAGQVSLEEVNEKLREGVAAITTWVVETYKSLTEEEEQQLAIPPSEITKIDTALPGSPGDTDVDTGPITTPENGEGSDSGTVTEDQSGQVDDSGGIIGQVEITIEPKVKKQADKRGWTEEDIVQVIDKPEKIVKTKDTRWNNDSKTKRNDPATAYFDAAGNYVVRNDVDGTIVQVSNKNDPDWKDPF